jgi:hypothetical protein
MKAAKITGLLASVFYRFFGNVSNTEKGVRVSVNHYLSLFCMEEVHSVKQPNATNPIVSANHTPLPSASELLSAAWELFKKKWLLAIGIVIGPMVIDSLISQITGDSFLLNIISSIASMALSMIGIALVLRFVRGEIIDSTTLFNRFSLNRFLQYAIGSIVMGVAVLIGLVLFIVPGIYIGVRLSFTLFLIVDTEMDFMTALKTSWAMTEGRVLELFLLGLIVGVILLLLTIVTLFIGILATAPVGSIAGALLYNKLKPAKT